MFSKKELENLGSCVNCGEPATHRCSFCGWGVCGAPLCGNCSHDPKDNYSHRKKINYRALELNRMDEYWESRGLYNSNSNESRHVRDDSCPGGFDTGQV